MSDLRPRRAAPSTIGAVLMDMRIQRKLKQSDLGRRIGRTQAFVSRYERGILQLTFEEVAEICEALDTPFEVIAQMWYMARDLFDDEEEMFDDEEEFEAEIKEARKKSY